MPVARLLKDEQPPRDSTTTRGTEVPDGPPPPPLPATRSVKPPRRVNAQQAAAARRELVHRGVMAAGVSDAVAVTMYEQLVVEEEAERGRQRREDELRQAAVAAAAAEGDHQANDPQESALTKPLWHVADLAAEVPVWVHTLPEPLRQELESLAAFEDVSIRAITGTTVTDAAITPRVEVPLGRADFPIQMVCDVPVGFPIDPQALPKTMFRSSKASRYALSKLEELLLDEIEVLCGDGLCSMLTLLGRTHELVGTLSTATFSEYFGLCVTCSNVQARQQRRAGGPAHRLPVPLRRRPAAAADSEAASSGDGEPEYECLLCGAFGKSILHVPSLRPNANNAPCSFCFFEDQVVLPMSCGCLSCYSCFSTFASDATGRREVLPNRATGLYGVACPVHNGAGGRALVVFAEDARLFKLLDTPAFQRYHRFALLHATEAAGARVCVDPTCCGLPTVVDIFGQQWCCAYCKLWQCHACRTPIRECSCKSWPAPMPRRPLVGMDVYVAPTTTQPSCNRRSLRGDPKAAAVPASGLPGEEDTTMTVLLLIGTHRLQVDLPTQRASWMSIVRDAVPDEYKKAMATQEHLDREAQRRLLDFIGLTAAEAQAMMDPLARGGETETESWLLRTPPLEVIFAGTRVAMDRPLSESAVHHGGLLYVLLSSDVADSRELADERELFEFRQRVAAEAEQQAAEAATEESTGENPQEGKRHSAKTAKKALPGGAKACPKCHTPVLHYHNHGCHHIGFSQRSKCCGYDWCYQCLGPYPCKTCPLMCDDKCGCPLCPECRPNMPCDICWGCKNCRGTVQSGL